MALAVQVATGCRLHTLTSLARSQSPDRSDRLDQLSRPRLALDVRGIVVKSLMYAQYAR